MNEHGPDPVHVEPAEVERLLAEGRIERRVSGSLHWVTQQPDLSHTCTFCRVAWVDSDNGFDTCASCASRI